METHNTYDIKLRVKDKYEMADFLHAIIPDENKNIIVKGYLPDKEVTGIIFPNGTITSYISG